MTVNSSAHAVVAPANFDGLVEAWLEAMSDIRALGATLDDEQWLAPTSCPGWTVADVVAHLIDIESILAGDSRPDHVPNWAELPHAESDFGRYTEVGVDARRAWTQGQLLAEFDEILHRREQQLAEGSHDLNAEVSGFLGASMPLSRLLHMRVFDSWIHSQDIRAAVGQVGALDSAGARVTFTMMLDSLPRIWGKAVQAPAGAVLEFDITRPGLEARTQVIVGADGRAGFTTDQVPDVRLSLSWPQAVRIMAGRISTADLLTESALRAEGDQALIDRLVINLSIAP